MPLEAYKSTLCGCFMPAEQTLFKIDRIDFPKIMKVLAAGDIRHSMVILSRR